MSLLPLSPLQQLFDLGKRLPDKVAMRSSERVVTYRKLASRVERSAARLQQEAGVQPGSVVACIGDAHPDAVTLFFALAASNASLLYLPQMDAAAIEPVLRQHDVALALSTAPPLDGLPFLRQEPLHWIVSTRCPYAANLVMQPDRTMLLRGNSTPGQANETGATLDALVATASAASVPKRLALPAVTLFDDAVFAPVVLAALLHGCSLDFT